VLPVRASDRAAGAPSGLVAVAETLQNGKDIVMVKRIYTGWYEDRVKVAADALIQQSNLDEELAVAYAKCVLYAVDHIPEQVR
jgi:hypothetical protein